MRSPLQHELMARRRCLQAEPAIGLSNFLWKALDGWT